MKEDLNSIACNILVMGVVGSRPDDGSAIYFKDQNRCMLLSIRLRREQTVDKRGSFDFVLIHLKLEEPDTLPCNAEHISC